MATHWLGELSVWWGGLPRDMAFLFALPFMIAAAGLLAHAWRHRRR